MSEISKEFSMAGAKSQERHRRGGFGDSPGGIELVAVMESTEGLEEGTREDMHFEQASLLALK